MRFRFRKKFSTVIPSEIISSNINHTTVFNSYSQLSWDGTTRKKMSRRKSHQDRLIFLKNFQKNHGSASL